MSEHVTIKERDHIREANFKDAYGVDSTIAVTNYNDIEWNWDKCVLNFKDTLGKNYGLIEYFKEGADNSTKFVVFEWTDKKGKLHQDSFLSFIDAEKALVDLMKKRSKGDDL